jgi:biopolymer transport protein ExbB
MGNGANFEGGVYRSPLPGNMLAMVYKGGPIVPVLLGLLMVVVFSFEALCCDFKSGWFRKP